MISKEAIYFTAVHDFSAVVLLQCFIGNVVTDNQIICTLYITPFVTKEAQYRHIIKLAGIPLKLLDCFRDGSQQSGRIFIPVFI